MCFLLTAPCYPAARKVIGAHLNRDLISGEDSDEIHTKLSGNMRQDDMTVTDIDLEHGVGQGLYDDALSFDFV